MSALLTYSTVQFNEKSSSLDAGQAIVPTENTVTFNEEPYSENPEIQFPFYYWTVEASPNKVSVSNPGIDIEESEDSYLTNDVIRNIESRNKFGEDRLNKIQHYLLNKNLEKLNKVIELDREYLESENVQLPNEKVINFSSRFIFELAKKRLFPTKISTSFEEGICFTFQKMQFLLYLELYNDGDFGYLIEDSRNKKIIESNDLNTISGFSNRIEQFYNQNAIP